MRQSICVSLHGEVGYNILHPPYVKLKGGHGFDLPNVNELLTWKLPPYLFSLRDVIRAISIIKDSQASDSKKTYVLAISSQEVARFPRKSS